MRPSVIERFITSVSCTTGIAKLAITPCMYVGSVIGGNKEFVLTLKWWSYVCSLTLADYISNFSIYLSVLQLLRRAPLMVRHTICQQVLSMLYHTPTHVTDITSSQGWESLFLWLLTPFDPSQSGSGIEEKEACPDNHDKNHNETGLEYNGSPVTYRRVKSLRKKTVQSGLNKVDEPGESGKGGETSEGGDPGEGGEDVEGSEQELCPIPAIMEVCPIPTITDDAPVTGDNGEGVSVKSDASRPPLPTSGESTSPSKPNKTFLVPIARPASMPILDVPDSSDDNTRRRSSAFLDSKTKGAREISIRGKTVIDEANQRKKSFSKKRQSLTYATSWDNLIERDSEEIRRMFSVVTETIAYLLWHSVDYDSGNPPWKVT